MAFSGLIASDDRYRGESASGHRPVATATISYDDPNGFYLGASFTAVAARDGIEPLRSVQYAGYARRLKSGVTLDIGLTHRISSHYATGEYAKQFTEAYVGIVGRRVSSHLFFSPDYDGYGGDAVYGEVEGLLLDRDDWSVSAHAGALLAPRRYPAQSRKVELDGRLGITRRFGRTALSLNWIGATPDYDSSRWRRSAVVSVSHSF